MRPDTKAPAHREDGRADAEAAGGSTGVLTVPRGADVRRPYGCPCGCETRPRLVDDDRCVRHRPRSRDSARAAWSHLRDAELLDSEGWTVAVLARAVAA